MITHNPFAPNIDEDVTSPQADGYMFGRTADGEHVVVELCTDDDEKLALFLDRSEFTEFLGRLTDVAANAGFLS